MPDPTERRSRIIRATHLLGVERYAEAAAVLAPVLADQPDDAEALGLLARAHLGREEFGAARRAAERAVTLAPADPAAHRLLASVLHGAGDSWAAVSVAEAAVRLDPDDWRSHHSYATVASALPGRAHQAWAAADRAVTLAPAEPAAHFVVGLAAQGRKDGATARAAYENVLRLDPTHAAAVNNLTVLGGSSRIGRAARGYARALALDPQQDTARRNVDALVHRFALRLYYGGAAAFLVAILVRGAASDAATTADGGSDIGRLDGTPLGLASYAVAAVIVVVLGAYVARLLSSIPAGIRRYAAGRITGDLRIGVRFGLAVVLLALALTTCLVPAAIRVTPSLILPVIVVNWIAVIALRRRR